MFVFIWLQSAFDWFFPCSTIYAKGFLPWPEGIVTWYYQSPLQAWACNPKSTVKVLTTPDDRVLDLVFITDSMELLHTKKRRDDTCNQLIDVLGDNCISCELKLAGPEYESQQGFSSLSPAVSEKLFSCELSSIDNCLQANNPDVTKLKKSTITVDNYLSPAHTLLQIQCADQKGLFYDIMRTLKDCNIQIFIEC